MKQKGQFKYALLLLAAAFFWGTTFAAQALGAGHVGPFTYLTGRSYLGAALLLPVIKLRDSISRKKGESENQPPADPRILLKAGVSCGFFLFISSALQQYGIGYSSTANASFITALYVVLVPILSLFLGKRPRRLIWISVALCVCGLYLLCMSGDMKLAYGDIFLLLCALGFSLQIMTVDRFSARVDGLKLSALEFLVTGIFATVGLLLFERPSLASLLHAAPAILYAAVFSNGVAYTCQIYGQRNVNPTLASLIMCLESVFGTLSGWLILHESLSAKQLAGCGLMLGAILLSTLPPKEKAAGEQSPTT